METRGVLPSLRTVAAPADCIRPRTGTTESVCSGGKRLPWFGGKTGMRAHLREQPGEMD